MTDQTYIDPVDRLDPADREELVRALAQWKAEGVENPTIPLDYDADGDGIVDAFGLDGDGNLVLVSGVALADTVAESTGEDATELGGAL